MATRIPHALVAGGTKEGANDVVPIDAVEERADDPSTELEPPDALSRPTPVDPDPTIAKPKRGP